jgi:GNAT superfamily N-acetyltransferase
MIFRQITPEDSACFNDALELLNRTQGRDLFNSTYMHRRTSDPLSFVVGAFYDELLMAVGVAQVLHEFEFYLPFDSNIVTNLSDKVVGSFSTLCVHESMQGKGVGQKLSQMRLEWLKERDCDVIVGISWVSGLPHTSNRVFEKMGFAQVGQVEQFFFNSSIENPFQCPGCGEPPCTCSATMYRLELSK